MPHTSTWNDAGFIREFTGVVTAEEILHSNFKAQSDSRFSKIKFVINDFLNIKGLNLNQAHTKIYAKTDDTVSLTKGKLNIAIVVVNKDHLLLAESYQQQLQNQHFSCEIFQNTEAAIVWGKGGLVNAEMDSTL